MDFQWTFAFGNGLGALIVGNYHNSQQRMESIRCSASLWSATSHLPADPRRSNPWCLPVLSTL